MAKKLILKMMSWLCVCHNMVGLMVLTSIGTPLVHAWTMHPSFSFSSFSWSSRPSTKWQAPNRIQRPVAVVRLEAASKNTDDGGSRSSSSCCSMRRLGLAGVSVSEGGFTVMWGLPVPSSSSSSSSSTSSQQLFWPWRVTTPQAGDKAAATSAQALTLCQLIAGVDLAGSRFPPDILAQVAVLTCEEREQNDFTSLTASLIAGNYNDHPDNRDLDASSLLTSERLLSDVHRQLQSIQRKWFPKEAAAATEPLTYTDSPAWIRARVRLPVCTLDQIVVQTKTKGDNKKDDDDDDDESLVVSFHVQVRNYGTLVLKHVTDEVIADALEPLYDDYTFSDETRLAFLTTALSLRYKAPVLLKQSGDDDDNDDNNDEDRVPSLALSVENIQKAFPLYTTVQKVQTPSDRVVSRIEKGWEIHQLQAAYRIALQKEDMAAVAKIRQKLDEMDEKSISELPVQADSELDSMQ